MCLVFSVRWSVARLWAISRVFSKILASAFEDSIRNFLALGSIFTLSSFRPLLRILSRFSSESSLRTNTRQRERRGPITSKDGFSVVAPMRTMSPFSTWGRSLSCWALLKRWISSMKMMGAAKSFC